MCCHYGNKSDASQHKKVKVKLLENWLKPRLEPHPWKYRLGKIFKKWGDEYQKEVEHSKRTSNALFGPDGDTVSHLTATHLTHTWVSRDEFIQGVIKEIRQGNTEVICSSVMHYILACKSIVKSLLFVTGDRFIEKPLPAIRPCRLLSSLSAEDVHVTRNSCTNCFVRVPQGLFSPLF